MQETQMKAFLREAHAKLKEQDGLLQRLTSAPFVYAVVLTTDSREEQVEQPWKKGDIATHKDGRSGKIIQVNGDQLVVEVTGTETRGDWIDPAHVKDYNSNIKAGDTVTVINGRRGKVQQIDPGDDWLLVELPYTIQEVFDTFEVFPNETVAIIRSFVVVIFQNKLMELEYPTGLELRAGDTVKLSAETMQVIGVVNSIGTMGEIAIVRRVLDKGQVEIDHDGNTRVVSVGKHLASEKGDRVILDSSYSIILCNLGKQEERFTVDHDTHVTWDSIGGLEEVKRLMIEAIELPYRKVDLYTFYNKKPVKGVLLYGPPGCGKTMLGKATATSLANLYGNKASSGFFYVKGPEILDKFVGNAEATIRQLFERARKHKLEHGYPAVIFIDEADAIMGRRGSGISSDIERTIVPMFLTEMDGMDDSAAVVILATNRPDVLDPAIVRDGRIDRKIKVTRPTEGNATEIFKLYLKNTPLGEGCVMQDLAKCASQALFSGERTLYTISLQGGTSMDFHLSQVVNGGMITGIVDQATSWAMRRDMENGSLSGLCVDDLIKAIDDVFRQNLDLDHSDELHEFTLDFRHDVVAIRPAVTAG